MIHNLTHEFLKRTATSLVLIVTLGGSYLHSPTLFILSLAAITIIALRYEWNRLSPCSSIAHAILSLCYPLAPFAILMWLTYAYYTSDFYLPLYPFFVGWTADTCGYLAGKMFGYHKICPAISPGKSWEGFMGSFAGVLIMHIIALPHILVIAKSTLLTSLPGVMILSLVGTSIAFLGGLWLSYLKRKKKLKDAGSLLPGHGGFLDRFDSVLAVGILTALIIIIFK